AVGKRYRKHAQRLAQDIQTHLPSTPFLILTDQPEEFREFPHVLAFKHELQSVKGYHDKRFVLEKSLSMFESCLFLDSDVRILGGIEQAFNWQPGITARAGTSLVNHLKIVKNQKEVSVIKAAAKKLEIDLENVQWLHEFMFAMKRQNGLEAEFFQLWQTISYFFEMQGIYHGECYAMGLAAARIGLTIDYFREDKFPFFKDNIERVRIKNGQSNREEKQVYFDMHKAIEYPKRSLVKKVMNKLTQQIIFYYRLLRLRLFASKDPSFSRLFG
ncbi:hypothetical protein IQ250_17655, partial [Pseudanabaenaceae cyanobacterium LEGE 13415]|nr:hypothetical protein [Pseudanabaenaceae cyanobacterium LEGE 13415]